MPSQKNLEEFHCLSSLWIKLVEGIGQLHQWFGFVYFRDTVWKRVFWLSEAPTNHRPYTSFSLHSQDCYTN